MRVRLLRTIGIFSLAHGSTSSSSLSIARRTITRSGSSRLCTVDGAAPRARISSTKPGTSARRSVPTFRLRSKGKT